MLAWRKTDKWLVFVKGLSEGEDVYANAVYK